MQAFVNIVKSKATKLLCLAALASSSLSVAAGHAAAATGDALFADDFEDGQASAWSTVSGSWAVAEESGNFVFKQGSASLGLEGIAHAGASTWTDYTVEVDLKWNGSASAGTRASGLIARYADSNNFYLFRHNATGQLELLKKVQGTYTLLASKPFAATVGRTYRFALSVDGGRLIGTVDGVAAVDATDASLTKGAIGFRTYSQSVSVDNVLVTDLSDGQANRDMLLERIDEAKGLREAEHAADGWAAMRTELAAAEAVYADADAGQEAVDAAAERLRLAVASLRKLPGETVLFAERVPYAMDDSNQAGWWSPLRVEGGKAYLAFNEPGSQNGYHRIAVAVQDEQGYWRKLQAMNGEAKAEYIDDLGHNQPSIAIDGDGDIHMFASMHNDRWRYFKSDFARGVMDNASHTLPDATGGYTYPVLASDPNGDVWLIIRADGNGRRTGRLYRYDNETNVWTREAEFGSASNRSVYPDDILVDAQGNVHILFQWSPFPSSAIRHDLSYVVYDPASKTFSRADGAPLPTPITPASAGVVIQPLTEGEAYNDTYGVQSAKLTLDENGAPHVIYRYRSASTSGLFQVLYARYDGTAWARETVFSAQETKAALDITSRGSELRLYYVAAAGEDRVRVAFRDGAAGEWRHLSPAPGLRVERLSVATDAAGADALYMVDVVGRALYYGILSDIAPDETPPSVPAGVVATATSHRSVELVWSASTDNKGVAKYVVYRDGAPIAETAATAYRDAGLTGGAMYAYAVAAVDVAGNASAPSAVAVVATPSEPELPYADDFDAPRGDWQFESGGWAVSAGALRHAATTGEGVAIVGSGLWDDYVVEAKMTLGDLTPNAASGLLARVVDKNNFYHLRLRQSGVLELYKRVNGAFQLIGSQATDVRVGTTYTLRLSVDGDRLVGSVNGAELLSVVDGEFARGAVGFRSYQQTVAFDELRVTSVAKPPVWTDGALTVTGHGVAKADLVWSGASDPEGVAGYRLYVNGELAASLDGTVTSFQYVDLAPGATYAFQVQAGDASGTWSEDGPTATVEAPGHPPKLPPGHAK